MIPRKIFKLTFEAVEPYLSQWELPAHSILILSKKAVIRCCFISLRYGKASPASSSWLSLWNENRISRCCILCSIGYYSNTTIKFTLNTWIRLRNDIDCLSLLKLMPSLLIMLLVVIISIFSNKIPILAPTKCWIQNQ